MSLTPDRILSLAPDQQVLAAGQKLARPANWQGLGRSGGILWGQCRGSAIYQVNIDVADMAFKCSCPSRKQPCKHVIGLLSLTTGAADLPETEPPPPVLDWLARRAAARAKTAEPPAAKAKDEKIAMEEKARRVSRRQERVAEGIDGLDLWLSDIVRDGLAGLEAKPRAFWARQAARLVDTQAPGLASQVRRLASVPGSSPQWPDRLLDDLGRLALLTRAYSRLDELSPARQFDVRQLIGWNLGREEVSELGESAIDTWACVGQYVEDEDGLHTQRTWLIGLRTRRTAIIIQFSPSQSALPWVATPGTSQEMELRFWPGAFPQRARIDARQGEAHPLEVRLPGHATIEDFFTTVAEILATNPWIERFLCLLHDIIPIPAESGPWMLRDSVGSALPLRGPTAWTLLAASGGRPVDLWGEWDGRAVKVLGYDARNS
jgi:hypothetical protein